MSSKTILPTTKWIWPFELIEQIGEGGMGVVFRARYVINNRELALKMLPGDVTDATVLARFEREMEVLKNLKHPHIVRCFGGVCEDKQRFYAMELLPGGSLEDVLQQKRRFSPERLVEYGMQMCAALEASHRQGVVHRDIKPSNFLLTAGGSLKLSDFGLASVAAARRITSAGKTAGTLLYMSPEQVRGQEITPLTDIYALGCVFYEFLTGKPPFVGETAAAMLHMHCKQEPPRVSALVLDCPTSLDQLVLRMMAKDPAQRPQSAIEVAKALRAVTYTVSVKTQQRAIDHVQPPRSEVQAGTKAAIMVRSHWDYVILGTLLACCLALGAWVTLLRRDQADAHAWHNSWLVSAEATDPSIRIALLRQIGTAGHDFPEGWSVVSTWLEDQNPEVRMESVRAMELGAANSRSFQANLVKLSRHEQAKDIRAAAEHAMQVIKGYEDETPKWHRTIIPLLLVVGTIVGLYHWYLQATADAERILKRPPGRSLGNA